MSEKQKIAIAQISPTLGDIDRNLNQWLESADKAKQGEAALVVFPELGLTGYFLRDMVPEVALSLRDEKLRPLLEKSKEIEIIGGLVEESSDGLCYNSSFYLSGGEVRFVHRKVYLPTYGMFEEQRYFASGDRLRGFMWGEMPASVLICEDMWHLSSGYVLCCERGQVLFALSASPARGATEDGLTVSARYWQLLNQVYARFFGFYVVFANRVGWEDGIAFWGGSEVVEPGGKVVARARSFEPELLFTEIDPQVLRRERRATPILRDEKLWLVLRELQRVYNERACD